MAIKRQQILSLALITITSLSVAMEHSAPIQPGNYKPELIRLTSGAKVPRLFNEVLSKGLIHVDALHSVQTAIELLKQLETGNLCCDVLKDSLHAHIINDESAEKNYNFFCTVRKILDTLSRNSKIDGNSKSTSVVHAKNQTLQGVFLECISNVPAALWTPWGRVLICKSTNITDEIMKAFDAQPYVQEKQGSYHRIVYRIQQFNDAKLPLALERSEKTLKKGNDVQQFWTNFEARLKVQLKHNR